VGAGCVFVDNGRGAAKNASVVLSAENQTLALRSKAESRGSGGEHLSSGEVSSLPLNTRDFSKLLLLAAGTMTDTNGAANFTQQFATNGQRGTASVFANRRRGHERPGAGRGDLFEFQCGRNSGSAVEFGSDACGDRARGGGFCECGDEVGGEFRSWERVLSFLRNASLDAANFFDHPNASIRDGFRRFSGTNLA